MPFTFLSAFLHRKVLFFEIAPEQVVVSIIAKLGLSQSKES
jgi:hypothetical protein